MIKRIILIITALALLTSMASASWRGKVRTGDKLYEQGKYDDALVKYLEGLSQKGDSARIGYDLGNVFQGQEKFKEAGQAFQGNMARRDSLGRADALYNLGNALFGEQKYQDAAQAYKSALKLKPAQTDYLHNLALAEKLIQKQQQQQKNKDNKDQKDQKQDQQQNQDKQKQDQQKQDQQKQQDQKNQQEQDQAQQNQDQKKDQDQQQQQPLQAQQMSKEDALRLLNAIQSDEKRVQENLHKQPVTEGGVAKDW
ncbi:MAG: tetratricopeptide repeat protein [bacterium]|nr:tetratricopeptide repeat protein [bacterium]